METSVLGTAPVLLLGFKQEKCLFWWASVCALILMQWNKPSHIRKQNGLKRRLGPCIISWWWLCGKRRRWKAEILKLCPQMRRLKGGTASRTPCSSASFSCSQDYNPGLSLWLKLHFLYCRTKNWVHFNLHNRKTNVNTTSRMEWQLSVNS